MRALWRLARSLHPDGDPDTESRFLRAAARRLSDARERVVLGELLAEILGEDGAAPGNPSDGDGDSQSRRDLAAILPGLKDSVRKFLGFQPVEGGDAPWEKAMGKAYARARDRIPESHQAVDADFHAWRQAVKALLYPLEAWPGKSKKRRRKLVEKLDLLQDRLGRAHDCSLLEKALRCPPGERRDRLSTAALPEGKALKKALREAASRKRAWKRKCLSFGRKLFNQPPRKFRGSIL